MSLRPPLASTARPMALARANGRHLAVLLVVCLNAWLLVHFHDRFWWAPDEGNYAHVAERLLDGQVLHADVQDIHPGYVNFANAGALALFGRELASLRYPLVVLGIVQSLLLFLVLRPGGLLAASAGATAVTALGFLQFLNPTAHWYCLFLTIALVAVLHGVPRTTRWRLDVVGALVMTIVLFRQLSGVLIAMGALTWLLLEAGPDASHDRADDGGRGAGAADPHASLRPARSPLETGPWLARGLLGVMIAGLVGYLARATDSLGWLLFGIWPVLVMVHALRTTRAAAASVVRMAARLARGGLLAALPLVAYHVANGSLGAWYRDALVTAIAFPRLPFFGTVSFATLIGEAARGIVSGDPVQFVNGVFWLVLPLVGAVVGLALLLQLRRAPAPVPARVATGAARAPAGTPGVLPPLVVLAPFYAVVSVHYQIPIKLAYTVGLSLAPLHVLTRGSRAVIVASATLALIGIVFHAGQPLSRGLAGALDGDRVALVASEAVPRVGLRIEPADVQLYGALLALIEREVPPDESILAIPSHAELYFLSGRRNPFRFYNSALGVSTPREMAVVLSTLDREPPALVFFDRRDKYNTDASRAIMERVRATYEPLPPLGGLEIYRRRMPGEAVAARGAAQSSMR